MVQLGFWPWPDRRGGGGGLPGPSLVNKKKEKKENNDTMKKKVFNFPLPLLLLLLLLLLQLLLQCPKAAALLPPSFLIERMAVHNPEHSCPQQHMVDWPGLKKQISECKDQRILGAFSETEESFLGWRGQVAAIYGSDDLDYCPLGVQTVHTADVERRLDEFDAASLGDVFESHLDHFMQKTPMLVSLLSGWPIYHLYSLIVGTLRKRPGVLLDLGQLKLGVSVQGSLGVRCRGSKIQVHEVSSLASGLKPGGNQWLLTKSGASWISEFTEDLENYILLQGPKLNASESWHCQLSLAIGRFAQAMILATASQNEPLSRRRGLVLQTFGSLLAAVEGGEASLYSMLDAASGIWKTRREALAHSFLFSHQLWPMLAQLQDSLAGSPWSLSTWCDKHEEEEEREGERWWSGAKTKRSKKEKSFCPACSVPKQVEWFRETQWVKALVAAGGRGDLGEILDETLRQAFDEMVVVEEEAEEDVPGSKTVLGAERSTDSAASSVIEAEGHDRHHQEAWATLLCDDDASSGHDERALWTYLEVVRVMAHSVRRWERGPPRPFLVLMAANTLTLEVRRTLLGDGLTPLELPSFDSEGVAVPLRQRQRNDVQRDAAAAGEKAKLASRELSWWLKLRLWALTDYRRVVYLDADMLVDRGIDELFNLPDEVLLAAPVHSSREGRGDELSVGIMSLRPDKAVFRDLVLFLRHSADRLLTGVRSVDQLLQQTFFARFFEWRGYVRWDASGNFHSCGNNLPNLHAGADLGPGPIPGLEGLDRQAKERQLQAERHQHQQQPAARAVAEAEAEVESSPSTSASASASGADGGGSSSGGRTRTDATEPPTDDEDVSSGSSSNNNNNNNRSPASVVCILPPYFDFCVTYPALVVAGRTTLSEPSASRQDELSAMFAEPTNAKKRQRQLVEGWGKATWEEALQAKVLHWTGPRRKPWLHWLPLAMTPFDDLWWREHAALCSEVEAGTGSDNDDATDDAAATSAATSAADGLTASDSDSTTPDDEESEELDNNINDDDNDDDKKKKKKKKKKGKVVAASRRYPCRFSCPG